MKILVISDTHNKHLEIPNHYIDNADGTIDTIIHAGDVSGRGYKNEIIPFLKWYNELPFTNKILIAGNHDFYFETANPDEVKEMMADYPNIIYLNDSGFKINDIKIWGTPVQPWFYNWAFNRKGSDICKHWDMIPLDTNILIIHGGPKNISTLNKVIMGEDVGCPYLTEKLYELKDLSLFCQGHIHEGYGSYQFADGTLFVNASLLNRNYEMVNKPYVLILDELTKKITHIE